MEKIIDMDERKSYTNKLITGSQKDEINIIEKLVKLTIDQSVLVLKSSGTSTDVKNNQYDHELEMSLPKMNESEIPQKKRSDTGRYQ